MDSNDQILDDSDGSPTSEDFEQESNEVPTTDDVVEDEPTEIEATPDEPAVETTAKEASVAEDEPVVEEPTAEEASVAEDEPAVEEPTAEEDEAEAVTAEADEPDEEEMSDKELFLAAINDELSSDEGESFMFTTLERGQIVEGAIASKNNNEILVDVGAKTEGLITGRELDSLDSDLIDSWEIGDEISVYVLTPEDRQGNILLSVRRAQEAKDWERAAEFMEASDVYETKITAFNKGGLLVNFGQLRGFIPASQVSSDRRRRATGSSPEERFGGMVGEDINVKVIEVNKDRNRLILSERAAYRELRAARREELLETLQVGEIREGRVTSLTDFGAFVDLGGIDGLIHISQLAWRPVDHPRDVLKQGEEVEVEIISIDTDRQRIGLSRKSQLPDPWTELAQNFAPDQLVRGEVTKLTNFGAFARLEDLPAIEGLIHISELAEHRVGHPSEIVHEGQVLTLRIIRIEEDRRRLGLSLKRVSSSDYLEEDLGDWRSMLDDMSDE
jgi:small subunit ribosomal protein S1